jgi:hypothetical protein
MMLRTILKLMCAAFLAWGGLGTTEAYGKPTRAECIIGYRLDWSTVKDATSVHNSMGELPMRPRSQYLAGDGFSADGTEFYLQYKDHCDHKEEMAKEVIHLWQSHGLDLPKMMRIPDPVKISIYTIDIRGPEWSDGADIHNQ